MYKVNRLWIFWAFFCLSGQSIASIDKGSTDKTAPIIGAPPYMKSVTGIQDIEDTYAFDSQWNPITYVNAMLHVPTSFCIQENSSAIAEFSQNDYLGNNISSGNFDLSQINTVQFVFGDRDGDICAFDESHEVEWYILDNGNKAWESITSWDDLSKTLIDNERFPGSILPPSSTTFSKYSQRLVIPESALNKRIGFIYTPKSKVGTPNTGPDIKVWDLNFSFGQHMNLEAGIIDESNVGFKIKKIDYHAGGGIVYPKLNKPSIDNLFIEGKFMPGETLKASYEFKSNNTLGAEEMSRFWWEVDEQKEEITLDNTNYTLTPLSNIITDKEMGKIIFVTVLPILKTQNDLFVVGNAVTTSTVAEGNNVKHLPYIRNLNIEPLKINNIASATYNYNYFGADGSIDSSDYTWEMFGRNGNLEYSQSWTVTQSGRIDNGPELKLADAGKLMRITMLPKTSLGVTGTTVSSEQNIESLLYLNMVPPSDSLKIGGGKFISFRVVAQYWDYFTDVTKIGQWKSLDSDVLINAQGIATLAPTASENKIAEIEFTYEGRTQKAFVEILLPDSQTIESMDQ
ncbi:hypothetical protein [Thorsellia kenyensis]|uniref:Uncharacterized protein n=1 Tax=Thorsellia kenyensis TaxID=1549888 RepID=A0ABV6C8C9_9GAMM